MGCTTEESTFISRLELEIFLFSKASEPAVRATQPHIPWEPGAYKGRGRGTDQLFSFRAVVEMNGTRSLILLHACMVQTATSLPVPPDKAPNALIFL